MQLGIIGLGKMGGNLALQANEKKIAVIGKARSKKPVLEKEGVKVVTDYESFVGYLKHPRIVYLSLPAGPTVDGVLDELVPYLEKGDVVMDGGNSFYLDSIEREKRCMKRAFISWTVVPVEDWKVPGTVLVLWLAVKKKALE